MPGSAKEEFGQRCHSHKANDEDDPDDTAHHRKDVKDSAETLPALALWIEEDLLTHNLMNVKRMRVFRLRPSVILTARFCRNERPLPTLNNRMRPA